VRSQREMFEYQIGLEREELEQYPDEEAAELALIYAAKAFPGTRGKSGYACWRTRNARWIRWRARSWG